MQPLKWKRSWLTSRLDRFWLENRLGITDSDRLMFVEAGHRLPPACERGDLLLVDRTMEKKLPGHEGIYVLSGACWAGGKTCARSA